MELETLIQTIRIYSQYIRMKFGIEKCTMLIMKSGKRQTMKGIGIRMLGDKENYKHLKVLEAGTIKQMKMIKKKKKKEEKSTSEEQENFSKSSSAAEISSKG